MLFRALAKDEFKKLVETILQRNEVVGPTKVGVDKDGKPIHQFLPVTSYDELDLGYSRTTFPAKTYFLPYKENLSTYRFQGGDWQQDIHYRIEPRALIGLHACDIHALLKLDKVMAKNIYPSAYYVSRRENTFILGIDHEPCESAFCQSMGCDTVDRGFDLFLTDLGNRYFVAIGSDKGYTALQRVKTEAITPEDRKAYAAERARLAGLFKTKVDVRNLPQILDIEFESDAWKPWGDKCLSCGSCAMVCPTCYCYGVTERVDMDFAGAQKVKQLHSCNLVDFALVAGGHNFRPASASRLKYRYYHQHRGFVEEYEEPMCVGCNRCGQTCTVGINPPDVIGSLQAANRPR